jgi:hypothetical protein
MYAQAVGQHQWFIAPSGTAGNTFTFTQAMTLNASGNLSIGNTNDTYKLDVTGTGIFRGNLTVQNVSSGRYFNFVTDSSASYLDVSHSLNVRVNGASSLTTALTLASTGAATFSSSVTATQGNFINSASNFPLTIDNSTQGYVAQVFKSNNVTFGYIGNANTLNSGGSNTDMVIRSENALILSSASTERMRITSGGNLLIGTTTDNGQKLRVNGTSELGGITSIGSTAGNNGLSSNTMLRTTSGSTNSGASMGNCFAAALSGSGFDTGIDVNMGTSGATMLLMASINTSTGTSTNSAVYIVRFYFDGNNAPTTSYLGGSSDFVTFSVSGSNTLILTASNSGNRSYSWFINKIEKG